MTSVAQWIAEQLGPDSDSEPKWYPQRPKVLSDSARWRSVPDALTPDEITQWLEFLEPFSPSKKMLKNLEKLTQPNTRIVITGQQPGLLGGPLYTVYKALSAIHWAEKLEKDSGQPVVPVFWIASDDHDFEEVATAHWLGKNHQVETFTLDQAAEDRGKPVYDTAIDPNQWKALAQKVQETLPETEYTQELLEHLKHSSPETLEAAFLQWFCRVFQSFGIIPLVPRIDFLRRRALPILQKELDRAPATSEHLASAQSELEEELGIAEPGIHRKGNELNFFWHRSEGRCRLELLGDQVQVIEPNDSNIIQQISRAELSGILQENPVSFSPNAALRPIVQDAALANIATIGGPGELLYHAQLKALYPEFQVQQPTLIPRAGAVLLTSQVARYLKKFHLSPQDILTKDLEEIEAHVARLVSAYEGEKAIDSTFNEIAKLIQSLDKKLADEYKDGQLGQLLQNISEFDSVGSEKLKKRLFHTQAQRAESASLHLPIVLEFLRRGSAPQERYLTAISPLQNAHGPNAIASISNLFDGCSFGTAQVIDLTNLPK